MLKANYYWNFILKAWTLKKFVETLHDECMRKEGFI